jgi:predicted transcriptional regulator
MLPIKEYILMKRTLGRPKIEAEIEPQIKIKKVLARKSVQRNLAWLSREANITYPLLHQIVSGKRRLQEKQADRILHTLHRFNIDVTYDEVFI